MVLMQARVLGRGSAFVGEGKRRQDWLMPQESPSLCKRMQGPRSHLGDSPLTFRLSCGSDGKELPAMQETRGRSLGQEGPLEKGMASHSSILDWRVSWTEEHSGL